MVSGYDVVLISSQNPNPAVRAMLDEVAHGWPDVRVAVTGMMDDRFTNWSTIASVLPDVRAEILVARDRLMEARWDDVGYELDDAEEGPFAIYYEPATWSALRTQALVDPYGRSESFDPYEVFFVGPHIWLVTLVTPDRDSRFSRGLLDLLTTKLTS